MYVPYLSTRVTYPTDDTDRLFSYKFLIKKGKPRPKLERKKIGSNAQRLHKQMYTALAE